MAMSNLTTTLLILTIILLLLPTETYAFGAGDIPDFAYLNDKAFRHGDIENILETLVKNAGRAASGGGLLGFAQNVIQSASGGAKFSKGDIKKVYFGNWLRDYSQAMDIAGLSKLTADSLVLVVSVLGFMTFGFATEEFQVTPERLGVYLPTEHIDNPKGYAEKEGDARKFHPKLRPPVDPRELEIDHRTGMKNYMATEDQGWDSSTALIRRTFRSCIEYGRRAGGKEGADLCEAYRLLGTGLHTMEDLLAHSNWCEIALRKMGHREVFCHVGDNVTINTPNGQAPPLVTGTFGGADFIHSLMGEATDKLSQASVTDLSQKMNQASQGDNSNVTALKNILTKLPIGGDSKMDEGESIHAQSKAYSFNPDNIAPPEVQQQLLALLKWRDNVYRDVLAKIEMVPGLTDLLEELTNALNAYVYTVLAPWITPILQQATSVLGEGSKAVIDSDDQYAVFDDPRASDPSHSLLSKDHFGLILNEPAGKIAQIVVQNSVQLIVQAWADSSDPDQAINRILEAFHHPYYATGRSNIQQQMFQEMQKWLSGLSRDEAQQTIQALTKESVRNGKNKRLGSENETGQEPGYGGHSHGAPAESYRPKPSGGGGGGYNTQQSHQQAQYGGSRTEMSYAQDNSSSRRNNYGDDSSNTYGSGRNTGGESRREEGYGSRRDDDGTTYGSGRTHGGESHRDEGYGSRRTDNESTYGSGRTYGGETQREEGYGSRHGGGEGRTATYGSGRTHGGESHGEEGYGSRRTDNENTYGSGRTYGGETQREEGDGSRYGGDEERTTTYGSGRTYSGESQREEGYGSRRADNENTYGSGRTYGGETQREEGYGSRHGGVSQREEEYGSTRHEASSGYTASYGQSENVSNGYGGGNTHSSARTAQSSYYPGQDHGSRGGDEYVSSRTEQSSYQSSNRGGHGGEYGSSGYGREEHSGRRVEASSGYAPSYGGSGGDGEETFGAERLNINEDENEGYVSSRRQYGNNY